MDWTNAGWSIYTQIQPAKAQGRAMGNELLFKNGKTFTCQDCIKVFEINIVMH